MDLEQSRCDPGVAGCGFFNSQTNMMIPKGPLLWLQAPSGRRRASRDHLFWLNAKPKASSTSKSFGVFVEHTEGLKLFTVDVANLLFVAYQSKLQLIGFLCGFLSLCRE